MTVYGLATDGCRLVMAIAPNIPMKEYMKEESKKDSFKSRLVC
jgi:hypothetical protein